MTLDGTTAPLNVPGTYTIKLYVAGDAGDPNYVEAARAALTVNEAPKPVSYSGSFGQSNYTLTVGDSLNVGITANATNANLSRVTVNVDASGYDRLASTEISGTSWSGSLTLDGTTAPLDVPGTYTIKLFVAGDAGDPNYAEAARATLIVTEAQSDVSYTGSFTEASYTMAVGETLNVGVTANATNANLTRITVNVDASGYDRLASTEISGTSWSGSLTLDGTTAPLDVPGTYTIKLFVAGDAGDPNYVEAARATLTVTLAKPEVNVKVIGSSIQASWNIVPGASRYVYSLRDLTDDKLIENHAEANERSINKILEAEKNYLLAVAAVPDGVDDIAEPQKCSWTENTFTTIARPNVTITVDGLNMTASWGAVEGASRYVYSLRNLTDEKLVIDHKSVNDRSISLTLDAWKDYRLAVGAVPEGVDDVQDSNKCSWSENTFNTDLTIGKPDIKISLEGTDMTATWDAVDCAERYVYSLRNLTDDILIANHVEANNRRIYLGMDADKQYRLAVGAVPAGVDDVDDHTKCGWSEVEYTTAAGNAHVHSYEKKVEGTPVYQGLDDDVHSVTTSYKVVCTICGELKEQYSETVNANHTFEDGYEAVHPHKCYKACTACSWAVYYEGQYKKVSTCCDCYGHAWNIGNKQYINGTWYVACRRCGQLRETSAPVIEEYNPVDEEKEQEKTETKQEEKKSQVTVTVSSEKYIEDENGNWIPCPHNQGIIYSAAHPHQEMYCAICGESLGSSPENITISSCEICFSQGLYTKEKAIESAQVTLDCYHMDTYFGSNYNANTKVHKQTNAIGYGDLSHNLMFDLPGQTEALITTEMSDDGKLVLNISMQGSQDLADWLADVLQTGANREGIHYKFDQFVQRFIEHCIEDQPETIHVDLENNGYSIKGDFSLKQLIEMVENQEGAHLCISGHSMGGSLAQIFTYRMLEDYHLSTEKVVTYTYAALPPFTKAFAEEFARNYPDANIYNYIHINDFAPDVGVTIGLGSFAVGDSVKGFQTSPSTDPYAYIVGGDSPNEATLQMIKAGNWLATFILTTGIQKIDKYPNLLQTLANALTSGEGGETLTGSDIGTNVYMNSEKRLFGDWGQVHAMETYYDLIEDYDIYNADNFDYVIKACSDYLELFQFADEYYGTAVKINGKWYANDVVPHLNYYELSREWPSIVGSIRAADPTIEDVALMSRKSIIGWNGGTSVAGDVMIENGRIPISKTYTIDTINNYISEHETPYLELFGY